MTGIDLDAIRLSLEDSFPQWTSWIEQVEIEDALGVHPVDNDGKTIYYNSHTIFYIINIYHHILFLQTIYCVLNYFL